MKKQIVKSLSTALNNLTKDMQTVTLRMAAVIAEAIASGDTAYLDAIAAAFAESLADDPEKCQSAMLYVALATGCEFDLDTLTFHGDPVLGNVELATGSMDITVNGKRQTVEWYNVKAVLAAGKRAEAAKKRAASGDKAVDFAKSVKSVANRVRKTNPIGATLLDTIAAMTPAQQAAALAAITSADADMPTPVAVAEAKTA